MTCIAAIEDGERVWIAADTGITAADGSKDNARGKVWMHSPSVGFGVAGGVSTAQLVRYGLKVPKLIPSMDGLEWCVRKLVPALRRTLGDTNLDEDGMLDIQLVVGISGCVYEIDPRLAVMRSPRGYTAIGSGQDFAYGSLFSTKKVRPRTRACLAVESACAHHAGCSLPIEIICVGGKS